MNVLNDNILVPTPNTQPLTLEHALTADANNALVRTDIQGRTSSVVVRARHPGAIVTAVLNPSLALRSAAFAGRGSGAAALAGGGAFCAGKVPGAVDQNRTGSAVSDPLFESGLFSMKTGAW